MSLHFPGHRPERERVIRQVEELAKRGIRSGVNLLVRQSQLTEATDASRELQAAGIGLERIMFLPMRGADTPSLKEMALVAGSTQFQSTTCLLGCAASPRFASLDWARRAAWCSYTESRRELPSLDFAGVVSALDGLDLRFCG